MEINKDVDKHKEEREPLMWKSVEEKLEFMDMYEELCYINRLKKEIRKLKRQLKQK